MVGITRQSTTRAQYGWNEDPSTWNLLRSNPPDDALRWVERQVGGAVESVVPIRGGMSSAVHRIDVHVEGNQNEDPQAFVLRRQVRPEVLDEEPDVVDRESAALELVRALEIPTPHFIANDQTGASGDAPALLMTHLPGETKWDPTDEREWLIGLAELLPTIHSCPRPPVSLLNSYAPFVPDQPDPPPWSRQPHLWDEALEIASHHKQLGASTLIHRDFHPGNVLWEHGCVTGLVDWMSAAWGPESVDVAHCRMNLIERHDRETADKFRSTWESVTGEVFDPTADVLTAVDILEELQESSVDDLPEFEEHLACALAEIR